MKHLYRAQTNALDFVIMRDMDTGKGIVVDFDLSDDEINEIANRFVENGYDMEVDLHLTGDDNADGWHDWDELTKGLFSFEAIG